MQPLSGNQRPDFLTSLLNMSLVLCLPRKMHLCRSSSNAPRVPSFLDMLENFRVLLTFDKVHNPLRLPRETTSERPKALCTPQFFALLTSKCASRHSGIHFFDISTSKSGPSLVCFVHFDFEMCFAPQRRALFRHLNFQSGPNLVCFVHFDFKMCFAPQRRAIFHLSSGQLAPHAALEPTFRLSGAPNHWKNTVFRDFPTLSRAWIFCLRRLSLFDLLSSSLTFLILLLLLFSPLFDLLSSSLLFSSLTLPISAFHLSTLSEV